MGKLPRWIIGFGVVLVAADLVEHWTAASLGIARASMLCGWVGGVLLVAAGLSAGQGRNSLRRGGLLVATLMTLTITALFAWEAARMWRAYSAESTPLLGPITLSCLALAGVGVLWMIVRLRPREGIASRGYTVAISPAKPRGGADPEPIRRSQAG